MSTVDIYGHGFKSPFKSEAKIEEKAFLDIETTICPMRLKVRQKVLGQKKVVAKKNGGSSVIQVAKVDIWAESTSGLFYIVEVKKFSSVRQLANACAQLYTYRFFCNTIDKTRIRLVLACDHIPPVFFEMAQQEFPTIATWEIEP